MKRSTQFAVCLNNTGNEASLIQGKIYVALPDARAAKDDLIRIVDEDGDVGAGGAAIFTELQSDGRSWQRQLTVERAQHPTGAAQG